MLFVVVWSLLSSELAFKRSHGDSLLLSLDWSLKSLSLMMSLIRKSATHVVKSSWSGVKFFPLIRRSYFSLEGS